MKTTRKVAGGHLCVSRRALSSLVAESCWGRSPVRTWLGQGCLDSLIRALPWGKGPLAMF